MGWISRDAETALPNIYFFMGRIIFDFWSFYGVLSVPQGQSVIRKTKIVELFTNLLFLVGIGWYFPRIYHTNTKGNLGWYI
jgi:hypothetical protein